jgi:hypothetical protein
MNVARVRRGLVINIEVVDDDSPQARELTTTRLEECSLGHQHAEQEQLVPYTDDEPAGIGLTYSPDHGFEQLPPPPPPPEQEKDDE